MILIMTVMNRESDHDGDNVMMLVITVMVMTVMVMMMKILLAKRVHTPAVSPHVPSE